MGVISLIDSNNLCICLCFCVQMTLLRIRMLLEVDFLDPVAPTAEAQSVLTEKRHSLRAFLIAQRVGDARFC